MGGVVDQNPTPPFKRAQPAQREVVMSHLTLEGDNVTYNPIGLQGDSSVGLAIIDTGTLGFRVEALVLSGTISVGINDGGKLGGFAELGQLADADDNDLTTVTIKAALPFSLGSNSDNSNTGDGVVTGLEFLSTPTTIHSSLTLINASATSGPVTIYAGATNTPSNGAYEDGASFGNVTVTYTGLTIKGGSGTDFIENDAKNGVVTDGNGSGDTVVLGGAGAKAILGTGPDDIVYVGTSDLGTTEMAGSALGDSVTFGAPGTTTLVTAPGAEAGSTALTTNIGLTKVHDGAAGMEIDFIYITSSTNIADETAHVAAANNLTTAENDAVNALAGAGVAYFNYKGSEYLIATNQTETAVSSGDAIVKLVGVTELTATIAAGVVTLHA
jgi:hypothetical protein